MGAADFYKPGSWNRICDRCGFKRKAEDTRKEWTGLIVCRDGCLDVRNPQDFVRGGHDRQRVPDPRPEAADDFLGTNEVTAASL